MFESPGAAAARSGACSLQRQRVLQQRRSQHMVAPLASVLPPAAVLQVQKVLVLVSGKALAGTIELCKARWPPAAQTLVPEVHRLVVQGLKTQDSMGVAEQQVLESLLARLRQLAADRWQEGSV